MFCKMSRLSNGLVKRWTGKERTESTVNLVFFLIDS